MVFFRTAASIRFPVLVLLGAYAGGAGASGFALTEQNASGLGNAYAGQAASAQDASTVFFNPAGLTHLQGNQFVLVGNLLYPSAKFQDNGGSGVAAALQSNKGGNGGDAGDLIPVPDFYYARDITPDLKFGLGLNSPFGLSTNYDMNWVGRFQALKSDLKTVDINPSLGFKVRDGVSLGVGLNAMRIDAKLTSMVSYSAAIAGATGGTVLMPNLSGASRMSGGDWGWGYNLGALFDVSPVTRIGLAYRSRVNMKLDGSLSFDNVPITGNAPLDAGLAATFGNGPASARLTLPDSFSASVFRKMNERVDLLADASWTHWGLFKELKIDRANGSNVIVTDN